MLSRLLEFATAWVLLPLVATALCYYLAVFFHKVVRVPTVGPLMIPVGFAFLIVLGTFITLVAKIAPVTSALVLIVAALGFTFDRWQLITWIREHATSLMGALVVFVVLGLPIIVTLSPTFAGWIKLDDGSSWLAFTDNLLRAGRDTSGLVPSTYEATVQINLQGRTDELATPGYPIGVFVPLGVFAQLLFIDPAWLLQSYMSWMVALLFISLFSVTSVLTRSRRLATALVVIACTSALLVGYVMWGGIKEAANAYLLALVATIASGYKKTVDQRASYVLLALPVAAYLAVFGPSGAAWVTPLLLTTFAVLPIASLKTRFQLFGLFTLAVLVMSLPTLATIKSLASLISLLQFASGSNDIGNLLGNLPFSQVSGIWLNGDFRYPAQFAIVNELLSALVLVMALIGTITLWQRKQREWLALILTLVFLAALGTQGNAWIGGKSIAVASPFVLWAAGLGVLKLRSMAFGREATVAFGAMALGVMWSFGLIYHQVWLAPYSELKELEYIGNAFGEEGSPGLMLEYSPYAARHFLRHIDVQGAGELRRDEIPMLSGAGLNKGAYADIDDFPTSSIDPFTSLVLRRSPVASVPPSNYELAWRGKHYEVWTQVLEPGSVASHEPLNDSGQASGIVSCQSLEKKLESADVGERLIGQPRIPAVFAQTDTTFIPQGWINSNGTTTLRSTGILPMAVNVPTQGTYEIWLSGWAKGNVSIVVDDVKVWSGRRVLTQGGQSVVTGRVELSPGLHRLEIQHSMFGLQPGIGGNVYPFNGVSLTLVVDDLAAIEITKRSVSEFCNKRWDWLELVKY